MNLMEAIIAAKLGGGGGGGSVTPASVLSALEGMTAEQAALALAAIDGEPEKFTITFTESGGVYSSDKTYSQISAALTAGKIVLAAYGNKTAYCIGNIGGAIQFVLIESYNNYSLTDGTKITFFDVEANDSVSVGSINYPPVSVDAASVLTAIQAMSSVQAAAVLTKIGGEPEKLTVTITYSSGVYSTDTSLSDILATVAAGKIVVAVYVDSGITYEYALVRKHSLYADFVCVNYDDTTGNLAVRMFEIDDGDAVSYSEASFQRNPSTVTDLSSTSITLAAADNTYYTYGELSALTISSFPAQGKFWIWFTSGSTPTTVIGFDNTFVPEANKLYKVTVERGHGSYKSWPTT